ncbi:hypothetical protein [Streptomyces griseorubiginosus]|uniref:hypothetical protein n=1 Tax=Streptomyces griseorubiginosus TaxID=67304 RepID=UPI002E802DD4|nr:hypothetical protein [Streptomyces griseorubiginosus]WUB45871.1 hypothetical protein OHN19_21970 [Streptomyces griseorubiginosus]WUB54391.1 hypothetical protein OG942_21970 [Streptomyces griseorubiginosus]
MTSGGPARLGDLLRTARALRISDPDGLAALAATLGLDLPAGTGAATGGTPSGGPDRRAASTGRPSRDDRTTARAPRSRNGAGPDRRGDTGPARLTRRSGPADSDSAPYTGDPSALSTHRTALPTGPNAFPTDRTALPTGRYAFPAGPATDPPGPDAVPTGPNPGGLDPGAPTPAAPIPGDQSPTPPARTATGGSLLLVRGARSAVGLGAEPPLRHELAPSDPLEDGTAELLGRAEAFELPWPASPPLPAPPWDPRTERALFLAVASTYTTGRVVDHPRLVELVVRGLAGGRVGRPRVPYRQRSTTRAGALLLLDRGESMRPFRHDQEWITRLAARILPPGGLRVLDLRIAQGVSQDRGRSWRPHPVPPAGQPVLLLSDLGHLQPPLPGRHHSSPASWLPYLRRLREAGCPVVCLTPYPAEEYPATVRRTVALVPLDRRVSVRFAQTTARRDPRRGGQPR